MRKLILVLVFLFPLTLLAQSSFTIKGFGKTLKDGDQIFLSYRQGDQMVYDSTLVSKGAFTFKGAFKTKVRGYICKNQNPRYANELFDSFNVYIEAGQIILNSLDTLVNMSASGTPLNNDNTKLNTLLKSIEERRKKLVNPDQLNTEQLKDTTLVSLTKAKMMASLHETVIAQFDFVNAHPSSYVSLLTLSRMARSSKLLTQVEQSFTKLSAALKAMPEGKEIANRIVEGKKVSVGMMAKDFIQNDINGNPVKLSAYQNKYVLVDFWASWCLPCREENPNLIAIYEQYKAKNFTILGVSIDVQANKSAWLKAIEEDQLTWTQVSDLKKENEAAKLYGITTIPSNVLINPEGKIIAKDLKGKELRDKLAELLETK